MRGKYKIKMAENEEEIISERVNAPFEEVKESEDSEEEGEESEEPGEGGEEDLEEEVIDNIEEPSSFTDFSSEVITPTLRPTPIPDVRENLEQGLRNVPAPTTDTEQENIEYTGVMPYETDYEQKTYQGMETEKRGPEIRETSVTQTRTNDSFTIRPSQSSDIMLTPEQRVEQEIRDYHETSQIQREPEERRIPFDRRERKRERILK